jgi:hypothetical protein
MFEYDTQVIHAHKGVKAVPTKSANATIRSRYMEQAASDLEDNRRRQQELTHQIEALQEEEKLLLDILNLAEHSAAVPEQTQGPAGVGGVLGSSKAFAEPSARRTKTSGRKSFPDKEGPGTPQRTLLGDLLIGLLKGQSEPRPAKELRDELLSKHPDRAPTPQVVRNTMEGLVAKGLVERHKQQRSVMYALVPGKRDKNASAGNRTA